MNEQPKRRARVVGIFFNDAAIKSPVDELPLERHEKYLNCTIHYTKPMSKALFGTRSGVVMVAALITPERHRTKSLLKTRWGYPDSVDSDQGLAVVSVRAAMYCCS